MDQSNHPYPSRHDHRDPATETFATRRDEDGKTPSEAVIAAAAAALDADPTRMRPLSEVIDLDALDSLFDAAGSPGTRSDCRVCFRYEGCRVVVSCEGRTVASQETGSDP